MFRFLTYKGSRFQNIVGYLRNIRLALFLLIIALLIGVVGFILIEGYTLAEAFYMTIITLSTVGYGEVQPLSSSGRWFASILIIFNLGIFTYSISTISLFILEGNLRILLKDFRVFTKIEELTDHVILCGAGRHGKEVMQELKKQHIPYVVIEKEEEQIEELREQNKILYIQGDATHDDILEEAGIDRARALVVTLGEEADNVYVVLTARQLNPSIRIISRALGPKSESKLKRAGANFVVMPERIGGFYMSTLVHKPDAVEFLTLITSMIDVEVLFEEVYVYQLKKEYQNKTLNELDIRELTGANVIGMHDEKGRYIINPSPDILLQNGSRLIVLGDKRQIDAFLHLMVER